LDDYANTEIRVIECRCGQAIKRRDSLTTWPSFIHDTIVARARGNAHAALSERPRRTDPQLEVVHKLGIGSARARADHVEHEESFSIRVQAPHAVQASLECVIGVA
jgi:hypothetical protein